MHKYCLIFVVIYYLIGVRSSGQDTHAFIFYFGDCEISCFDPVRTGLISHNQSEEFQLLGRVYNILILAPNK